MERVLNHTQFSNAEETKSISKKSSFFLLGLCLGSMALVSSLSKDNEKEEKINEELNFNNFHQAVIDLELITELLSQIQDETLSSTFVKYKKTLTSQMASFALCDFLNYRIENEIIVNKTDNDVEFSDEFYSYLNSEAGQESWRTFLNFFDNKKFTFDKILPPTVNYSPSTENLVRNTNCPIKDIEEMNILNNLAKEDKPFQLFYKAIEFYLASNRKNYSYLAFAYINLLKSMYNSPYSAHFYPYIDAIHDTIHPSTFFDSSVVNAKLIYQEKINSKNARPHN